MARNPFPTGGNVLPFETMADRGTSEPAFVVDLDGFEGPLDMLLALARTQKVDLTKISILALADQYLGFIEEARKLRLELAADYLVMAAWLAYLKSRLLIPEPAKGEGPTGPELAEVLAFRLQRLQAMRDAAARLMTRHRLGRDVFGRGDPEPIVALADKRWEASLYDLLTAYAQQREKTALSHVTMEHRKVWSLAEAREILERLVGASLDWTPLDAFLIDYLVSEEKRATVLASSFASSLELVREGVLEVHQERPLGPLFMRKRRGDPASKPPGT
ncbi:segregation and condensation protein A [Phreatobacter cathodiphilus]|uniref:Segregation and condensation protein A n=1 Tax=Phreatobacter cathodiphilus TaxID=1868589 RepID=A0A2S0NA75_9HYPH|nr:ScpA family protein [Phreatobacter cathodiphilus]AVO45048.1 segregation/condensation protein A [Phreatobacter cathodiphilus]